MNEEDSSSFWQVGEISWIESSREDSSWRVVCKREGEKEKGSDEDRRCRGHINRSESDSGQPNASHHCPGFFASSFSPLPSLPLPCASTPSEVHSLHTL